jgi:leukotriene-A4 hydrolase
MARLDPHSYNDSEQPEIVYLDWKALVDFPSRTLSAEAVLTLDKPQGGPLDLDTRDLRVEGVFGENGQPLSYTLSPPEPILGSRLRVILPGGLSRIRVVYRTTPQASALQWLEPAQTAEGRNPFLFSQCQAIHARSVVPLQDTPRVRIRFRAEISVPAPLRALVAAGFVSRREERGRAIEVYEMPQPIPPYLFAFAVGDLAARELGPRSRVWAEPGIVDRAAWEFEGVDAMLRTAEQLFGPYEWDRFDILTMPPSFPYGGMENPRLTFLTPSVLAGDRSLVSVVAHELAHSWTGNLVTNANANHFWLNEGFTVFAERRILEALEGPEVCGLQAALGRQRLERAVEGFGERPELTRLCTDLAGIDPDEAFSEVPYEKGYLFLRTLEEAVGRAQFSEFLRRYVSTFRFRSLTTEDFEAFVERELPGALEKARASEWLHGTGIPENGPRPRSPRLEAIEALGGQSPPEDLARSWKPTEWALYLESVPRPAPHRLCEDLDRRFSLSRSTNYEVLVAWLALAVESDYEAVLPRVETVLGEVGRMKFLKPLYAALARRPRTRDLARSWLARYEAHYHPIARQVVEGVLRKAETDEQSPSG